MNSVVLIGNGPDILNYEAGKNIDQFDVVVRFNNFEIAGYEKFCGSKIDIWATRICSTIKDREPNYHIIGIMNYCKYTQSIINLLPHWLKKYPETEVVYPDQVKPYSEKFGYDPNRNWLTVGMITIMYLLENGYDELYLHGFSGDIHKHYFKLDPKDPQYHRFDLEAQYIDKLHTEGKVKYLYE